MKQKRKSALALVPPCLVLWLWVSWIGSPALAGVGAVPSGQERWAQAEEVQPSVAEGLSMEGLDLVPADAVLILAVPSLRRLDDGLAAIATSLQLDMPVMANLLDYLKASLGLLSGLREEGSLVFYTTSPAILGGETAGPPPVFVLLPIADFPGFLANFGASEQGASTLVVTPIGPLFARSAGNFALLGLDQQAVEAAQLGAEPAIGRIVGSLGSTCLAHSQLSLVVNLERLAPILRPALQAFMASMAVLPGQEGIPPEALATSQAMLNLYGLGLDAILRDGTYAVLGLDTTESGVGATFTIQFRQGSNLAGYFPSGGGASSLWAMVPDRPFLAASAIRFEGLSTSALVDAFLSAFPESAGVLRTLAVEAIGMMRDVGSMVQVIYLPDPALAAIGTGLFNAVTVYQVPDAQAFVGLWQQYLEHLDGLAYPVGPMVDAQGTMVAGSMSYSTRYEAAVIEIGGVPVSRYEMQTQLPEGLEDPAGLLRPMLSIFGLGNFSGYVAATGNHVVITTRPDDALLESTLTLLTTEPAGEDRFAPYRSGAFHPDPAMEAFIDVGAIAKVVLALAQASNPEISLEVPDGLPPIALFGDVLEYGVSGRMVVPMTVLSYSVQLIRQLLPAPYPITEPDQGTTEAPATTP